MVIKEIYFINLLKKIIKFENIFINFLWGLGIGDWGLGIGDWAQSPIPNPQSPIPIPQINQKKINKNIFKFNNFF